MSSVALQPTGLRRSTARTTGTPPLQRSRTHLLTGKNLAWSTMGPPWIAIFQPRPIDVQSDLDQGNWGQVDTFSSVMFLGWLLRCFCGVRVAVAVRLQVDGLFPMESYIVVNWSVLFNSAVSSFIILLGDWCMHVFQCQRGHIRKKQSTSVSLLTTLR